jgi:CHAP domain
MTPLTTAVLHLASAQVGVRELGRNRGERVEEYQARAGARPGDPWCAAFVSWCFAVAANGLALPCPLRLTARALDLWKKAPVALRSSWPTPGAIFVIDHGGGHGHCGLVESFSQGDLIIITIEGNTGPQGGRDGDGVYRRTRRLDGINLGYVDYGRERDAEPVG